MENRRFSVMIEKLKAGAWIDAQSIIGLYNYGETFLHPRLASLVEILNDAGLRYSLSTNGSVAAEITEAWIRNLDHVLISMPGFSQRSYDRISKLDFEKVKTNISLMVRRFREAGFRGTMIVSYHVYQFNLGEVARCEAFARDLGLRFNPYFAILNDWTMLHGWLNGTLSADTMRTISEDLFCYNIRELMAASPSGYACPQWDYLVVNESSDVVTCCQLPPHQDEYLCGNICRDSLDGILERKTSMTVCRECLQSGLAYYLNNCLRRPEWISLSEELKGRITFKSLLQDAGRRWRDSWK